MYWRGRKGKWRTISKNRRILIVEDELIVAIDLKGILEFLGYSVPGIAQSGEKALDAVSRERPDLILMDIQLQGKMDGIETAALVYSRYQIPVIYVTAFSDDMTIDRAKLTEPLGYISKPFNHRELRTSIEIALYKHRMRTMLEDGRELLAVTLKSIGDAVVTIDKDGLIRFCNESASELIGRGRADLEGERLFDQFSLSGPCVSEESLSDLIGRVVSTGKAVEKNCTLLCKQNTRSVPVELRASPLFEAGRLSVSGIVFVFRDISEEIRSREVQSLLAAIVESTEEAVIGLNLDGKVQSWNRGAEKIFGYQERDLIGTSISVLTPKYQADELPGLIRRIEEGGRVSYTEILSEDSAGNRVDIGITMSPIRDGYGEVTGASLIARDISERKKLERELIDITARERQIIGQELHDNLGQQLTGILYRAGALQAMIGKRGSGFEHERDLAGDIAGHLRTSLDFTRNLARGMMPVSMKSDGLGGALFELAEYTESTYGVKVIVSIGGGAEPADPSLASQLYFIAREATHNAVKHGEPHSVTVTLFENTRRSL